MTGPRSGLGGFVCALPTHQVEQWNLAKLGSSRFVKTQVPENPENLMVVRRIITHLLAVMATVDAMALSSGEKFGPMRWAGEESTWAQVKFEFTNWVRRHDSNVRS